jgi:uncharacterized protein (DUF983 family)
MQTWSYIILGIIGWIIAGSIILGGIDKNLEITTWKSHAVWWLVLLMNLFWPIIMIAYLSKKKSMK